MVRTCSHQCVMGAAPQLGNLCSEDGEWSQGTQQGVQEEGHAVGHTHPLLQGGGRYQLQLNMQGIPNFAGQFGWNLTGLNWAGL